MINWGIIGAGNIAHRFVQALSHIENANLYAVSNRTIEKANHFKALYGANRAYDSFDELLNDEEIDVVYIALPHLYHVDFIKKAIKKNIAVLCEKPCVIQSEHMDEIIELSKIHHVFVMEAMKTKHLPLYKKLHEIIESKILGDVLKVETSLCHLIEDEGSYHYQKEQGGCLWDLGIYNTCYLADFLDGDYDVVIEEKIVNDQGVEVYVKAILKYHNQQIGVLETAFDRSSDSYALITLTKGSIFIDRLHRPTVMEVIRDDHREVFELAYEYDDFYSQVKYVCNVLEGVPSICKNVSLEDSKNGIKMIESIKEKL